MQLTSRYIGRRSVVGAAGILLAIVGMTLAQVRPAPRNVDYPFSGNPGSQRYSTLTQFNAQNVSKLKEAWRYELGGSAQIQNQPVVINGVIYGMGLTKTYALDAATGKIKWEYDPPPIAGRNPRGVGYWTDGKERRLLITRSNFIAELDADTGKVIPSFGVNGQIDLNDNLRGPASQNKITMSSPVSIYKDIFITAGGVGETNPASPGDIRGWDVRSGKLLWTFHTIPHPGEEGYDTWPKDSYLKAGGNNAWAGTTVDEARGIVFAATGSPSDDFYGGERLGANLFGNCVIALNATTGKKLWHFQATHHDLWDSDFASAPTLSTMIRNGKPVDVVVATNKMSYIYVFNRETGEPMFPIDEVPVPRSTMQGEEASSTQPVPRVIPPLSWTSISEKDLTNRTPEAHAAALEKFKTFANGGRFTPGVYHQETVMAPGFSGGVEWGGLMTDPNAHLVFFNSERIVWTTAITEARAATPDSAGQYRSQYTHTGYHKFLDNEGYPATAPPWGTLTALDLNTGKFVWQIPYGEYPELAAKGIKDTGSESYGSGVVTSTGLLFIGSSNFDSKMRVYDTKTGKLIWEMALPYPGTASPAMYMVNGRQYIAFSTSSGRAPKLNEKGSILVAYALPQ
jgi:quinoprotein glucose dehydrogenase